MQVRLETSVVIKRPIEEVFDFVTDFEKLPLWVPAVQKGWQESDGPMRVGSIGVEIVKLPIGRIEVPWETTEYVPYRRWRSNPVRNIFHSEVLYTFEAVEGGTRVDHLATSEWPGLRRLLAHLAARIGQRDRETMFANLKQLLEARDG